MSDILLAVVFNIDYIIAVIKVYNAQLTSDGVKNVGK